MEDETGLIEMTADIISAYVSNNSISVEALPALIASVHGALTQTTAGPAEPAEPTIDRPTAAAIRKSIQGDYLISFEDGRRYKSMKRSLALKGLTPQEYREKWGLPKDYPMVAPNYSEARSNLAKSMGLGAGGRKAKAEAQAAKPARKPRTPKAQAPAAE
jgi:predicted transcriptional regulator